MMDVLINVNHTVRVKLTDLGRDILQQKAERLSARFPGLSWTGPSVEADGTYKTQLWGLMHDFGDHMFAGGETPFETSISIDPDIWPRMTAADLGLNPDGTMVGRTG